MLFDLEVSQVERLSGAALREPTRHAAVRFLAGALPEVGADFPGVRNVGLLATQELRRGVPQRGDWSIACRASAPLLEQSGRPLVERLGFRVEQLSTQSSVLIVAAGKRAVAVFLDEAEAFDDPAERFHGSPVSHALALADRENLPWVVLTRGRQIRLYASSPDIGAGRKGRAETFVELNLALLPESSAGYLSLLFGADALTAGGSLEQIIEQSHDFAAELGSRLRDRVYFEAVPELAVAVARHLHPDHPGQNDLTAAYEETLVILFRLLFVAYGEDKDLLPYRTHGQYHDHALKLIARRVAHAKRTGRLLFDVHATSLWDDVTNLWSAIAFGNAGWGVPVYGGDLFSSDPQISPAGAALSTLRLTDAEFGPALTALLVDEGPDGAGPVDFRSLSVREFGTIYEGLLESNLSVAQADLSIDRSSGAYVPARRGTPVDVPAGQVYFHNRSGTRKATGSYFTKPFAVEHLLEHALEPALDDHLHRVQRALDVGDDAAATAAFFDFRCVDVAMGSAHFLVAAVDRIERRLSAFLALHPIPAVTAELDGLRQAALATLGDLAAGVEIENSSLLRRHIARRCIYGVDRNRIAVELARLAVWIHTFVPGLPLSFLDHNLVEGDSLTGIGTLAEALAALEPDVAPGAHTLMHDEITGFLDRARTALRRLATITDAAPADVEAARAAHREALQAVEPARVLFDLLVAARLGTASVPVDITEEDLRHHRQAAAARTAADELQALHLPVAFAEAFLGDRPGFDCVVGNPPWEEATVEELGFWALRYPGLKSLPAAEQRRELTRVQRARPDLCQEYDTAVAAARALRRVLLAGPYPGMGTGDPDLYKAFCWRFWQLARDDGAIGVVLPRSALSAAGSRPWRETVLEHGGFTDVTMILNNAQWAFEDVHPQYTFALVSVRKGAAHTGLIRLRGPYPSLAAYTSGVDEKPAEIAVTDFLSWSEGASFPLLPTARSVEIFIKLRQHPRLDTAEGWRARPATEFHATNDKKHFVLDADDAPRNAWLVYKGASFNLWEPDTGTYYGWADPHEIVEVLQQRRLRQQRLARSAFSGFSRTWATNPATLPCRRPRIAFRDIARATDTRTVITALVPPRVVLTNKAPYLLWPQGDERDEAYLLSVLSSIPMDWYARRVVEVSVNFHLFNAFPVPRAGRDDPDRRQVEEIAGRLAAVDRRYADWARAVGVPVGGVPPGEREPLLAELDAVVARLYGLTESELTHVFETFHAGWNYAPRLAAVLGAYHHRGPREGIG